jgi:hypothetical protein
VVTEVAARRPATSVFPTEEAIRSKVSLLSVGIGIGILRRSNQGCVVTFTPTSVSSSEPADRVVESKTARELPRG